MGDVVDHLFHEPYNASDPIHHEIKGILKAAESLNVDSLQQAFGRLHAAGIKDDPMTDTLDMLGNLLMHSF